MGGSESPREFLNRLNSIGDYNPAFVPNAETASKLQILNSSVREARGLDAKKQAKADWLQAWNDAYVRESEDLLTAAATLTENKLVTIGTIGGQLGWAISLLGIRDQTSGQWVGTKPVGSQPRPVGRRQTARH